MIFMTFHILGMSSSQLTDIFQRGWNDQLYMYICMYILSSWLWQLVDGFADIPLTQYGRWWHTAMLFVMVGNKTYVRHRSVDNYWSVNLESKNAIQWKIIRRFCQAKDAMVDSKVKGISTNYIVGILATVTSSNGVLNENHFSLSDSHLGTLFWHSFEVSDHTIWKCIHQYMAYSCCHSIWHSFLHIHWHSIWHSIWHLYIEMFSGIYSDILSSILSGIFLTFSLTFFLAFYLASILTSFLSGILSDIPLASGWGPAVLTEIWSSQDEGQEEEEE